VHTVPIPIPVLGFAVVFASEAKIEIEANISFRLEAKKRPDFACFASKQNCQNLKRNEREISEKVEAKRKKQKLLTQEKI
jgi:hypothetical protein